MPARPGYYPETVVFVLDVCEDPGIEFSKHAARLELLKQCIGHCAQAKSRVNPNHKFGLAVIRQDAVRWEGSCVTASAEGLMAALRGVQPGPSRPPSEAVGSLRGTARGPELGDVVSLVQPLAVAEEADGCRVRVVLVYCRSTVVPSWASRHRPGEALCMDVLFVHDKAAAAAVAAERPDCARPQDVYTWLEDNVDELSARCNHHAYIFEAGGHLTRKVVNQLISLVAHPAQRPPQRELRTAPLDLAAMPQLPTSAREPAAAPAAGTDTAAFPPLPPAPAPAAAAAAAATTVVGSGAWDLPGPSARSYSPPGLAADAAPPDLIELRSPSEAHRAPPPPPPPPPPAASDFTALPPPAAAAAGVSPATLAFSPPPPQPPLTLTGSPVPIVYRQTDLAAAAASHAFAGLTLAPATAAAVSVRGAEGGAAAATDLWAEPPPPAWSRAPPPPPPSAADPGGGF